MRSTDILELFYTQISLKKTGSNVFLLCVSVCVLAESEEIQELLSDHGISVQTMSEVLPIRVMPARILSHVYVRLGKQARFSSVYRCVCVLVKTPLKPRPSHDQDRSESQTRPRKTANES